MFNLTSANQPAALKEEEKYILKTRNGDGNRYGYESVYFSSYTNSAEMIVVKTNMGQKLRVARCDIYEVPKND